MKCNKDFCGVVVKVNDLSKLKSRLEFANLHHILMIIQVQKSCEKYMPYHQEVRINYKFESQKQSETCQNKCKPVVTFSLL